MVDQRRVEVLSWAERRSGMPYRLDPPPDGVNNIDCSLYVLKTFADAGLPFPPGVRTAEQIRQECVSVDWADVQPGDLLFFEGTYETEGASHVGISLGAGTLRMWNANEASGVGITDISTPYWQSHLMEAARPSVLMDDNQGPNLYGVDVSEHQGTIDWPVLASAVDFVIIRASQRANRPDKQFVPNRTMARAIHLLRAYYHFAEPATDPDPLTEVRFFRDVVGELQPGELVALDLEEWEGVLADYPGTLATWVLTWLKAATAAFGVKPLLYTNAGVVAQYGFAQYPEFQEYGLWLADWTPPYPTPAPWSRWTVLQTSAEGRVPGVSGDVDLDQFDGSAQDWVGMGYQEQPPVGPIPTPSAEFNVGSGVKDWMEREGTVPKADSSFLPAWGTASRLEVGYGADGALYLYDLANGMRTRFSA